MKRILISGANSYIGTSFEKYVSQWPERYQVDTIDMVGSEWMSISFSGYDVILHAAGIVHIKETKEKEKVFYKVNRDLVLKTAEKAKKEGVKQFVYLSTMSVYGWQTGNITKKTKPCPESNYGKSKFEAEVGLIGLLCSSFVVTIVRAPMVYGKGCKGNYQLLRDFILKFHIFPTYQNKRSAIYIDNLSAFLKCYIDHESSGIKFPQDEDYFITNKAVRIIAQVNGCKAFYISVFNPFIRVLVKRIKLFNKVFGDLTYDRSLSDSVNLNLVSMNAAINNIEE